MQRRSADDVASFSPSSSITVLTLENEEEFDVQVIVHRDKLL
jgi:hypothetical protein